jgi:hypothetical protein
VSVLMNHTDTHRPGGQVLQPMERQAIGAAHALRALPTVRQASRQGRRARPGFAVSTFDLLAVEAMVAFDSIRGVAQVRPFDALEG